MKVVLVATPLECPSGPLAYQETLSSLLLEYRVNNAALLFLLTLRWFPVAKRLQPPHDPKRSIQPAQ